MAVVVVHQNQLRVVVFTAPLNRLDEVAGHGDRAVRGVGVGTACHLRIATLIDHAGEQVALILITKRKRHVVITSPEAATDIFHNSKV